MDRAALVSQIRLKSSFLCVGLDPDPAKFPDLIPRDASGVLPFCKAIIDATAPFAVAYKLNIAFFEALGPRSWDVLYAVRAQLPENCFLIADAKRADIGNTAKFYARAFFEDLDFDAITVAPYMGEDSVTPFLEYDGKWTILLALTSNKGSGDFQMLPTGDDSLLFESVLRKAITWGSPSQLMFVAGATHPDLLSRVRTIVPENFLLVPGIGAQGGSLSEVVTKCKTPDVGILVNSSREILYASSGEDFAERAGEKAAGYQKQMVQYL